MQGELQDPIDDSVTSFHQQPLPKQTELFICNNFRAVGTASTRRES